MKKWLKKEFFIFIIFGISYFTLEILYRGYSHWTMIFLGGIVSVLIGLINEITPNMRMWKQMLLGTILVTLFEFILGYILNIKLHFKKIKPHLRVWFFYALYLPPSI